jgi:redox-sensitive bicupin YhaK (pirin superfamily)
VTYHDTDEPVCQSAGGRIALTIRPKLKDLGEFTVRRVLPSPQRRMVGPFIFFDHMGPAEFPPGDGIAVRPHPHIGIATVTYLFTGQIVHRDSLGYEQAINPGAVNLMTAGRGIVHSERAGEDLQTTSYLHGIQSWMALPLNDEETTPEFLHYAAATIPETDVDGVHVRVIMGEAYAQHSPVKLYSPTLCLECQMPAGSELTLPEQYEEIAAYIVEGRVQVDNDLCEPGVMAIAHNGQTLTLTAAENSRVMIVGGAALGKRHIWWNYVSSSKERIEQAKQDWLEKRFDMVPGDDEFIPLPD